MKYLNKKWFRFVCISIVFLVSTLNFIQISYAVTKAEQIKLSLFATSDTTTVRLYTNDTLSTDITHPYNNGGFYWPINIPITHAYNPYDDTSLSLPEFTLTARLPNTDARTIPSTQIRNELTSRGITTVECFIVFQKNSWKPGTPILFRPQPWSQPEASNTSLITHTSNILAYYAPIGGSFANIPGSGAVTTHPGELGIDGKTMMIFSGPDYAIPLDFNTVRYFYTIGIETATTHSDGTAIAHPTPRAAITLHVMYNEAENEIVKDIIRSYNAEELSLFIAYSDLPIAKISDTTNLEDFFRRLDAIHIIDTTALRGFTEGTIFGIIPN